MKTVLLDESKYSRGELLELLAKNNLYEKTPKNKKEKVIIAFPNLSIYWEITLTIFHDANDNILYSLSRYTIKSD